MKTEIKEIRQQDKDYLVTLQSSPFRKASGGQPCDFGTLSGKDFEAIVYDVLDQNTVKAKVMNGSPTKGEVLALIDEKRRKKLTRMHTAEHILFKSIQNWSSESKVEKIKLSEEEGVIYILSKYLDLDIIYYAEQLTNQIVKENRPIKEITLKRDEMHLHPELRINEGRVTAETFRAIQIQDHDLSACSGTHCQSTGEVGQIFIAKLNNSGQEHYEVKFKLDAEQDLFFHSHIARKVSALLATELEKVQKTLENLKEENERLKKIARNADLKLDEETLRGIKFFSAILEGYEKDPIMKKIEEKTKEQAIIAIINQTTSGAQLFLGVNENLKQDASSLIKELAQKCNGKGGGKKTFASGSFAADPSALAQELKTLLQKQP